MKYYLNILPDEQQKIYPKLSDLKSKGFILFGGTAIALQYGHRQSVDFDFFNIKALDGEIQKNIIDTLTDIKFTVLQNEPNTLTILTDNNVKLSFFGEIPFALQKNAFLSEDRVLLLAKPEVLLATKLKAINDRASAKDYIDIAEILKDNNYSLYEGLKEVEKMYNSSVPSAQILKGLVYFEDGDLQTLNKEVKNFLIEKTSEAERLIAKRQNIYERSF